jgi:replicative DNA helicase
MFIRRQSLRSIAVELTKALQEDTEESLEKADRLMSQAKRNELQLFDPGTRLNDKTKALRFLDYVNESFPTGIPELDRRGFGPTRKELWMLVGDAKSGKSMSLTHLAKMAIINRLKVVHVTLEMSEGRVAQRYFQTLYSVAKRPDISELVKFKKDAKGDLLGFNSVKLAPNMTLQDSGIRQKLEQIIDKRALRHLNNIYIKEYATGYLTMPMLQGYLDNLEATHKFSPDMLIVDYPDLMKVNSDNYRLSIDQIYKDLRGMAVERNIAVAVVSQSNRAGSKKKTLGSENIAEAYSKVQHADITITLSATAAEKRLGLARLYVTNARNDEGSLTLVISQNYRTGTFAVDAAVMSSNYWDLLPSNEEDQDQ